MLQLQGPAHAWPAYKEPKTQWLIAVTPEYPSTGKLRN